MRNSFGTSLDIAGTSYAKYGMSAEHSDSRNDWLPFNEPKIPGTSHVLFLIFTPTLQSRYDYLHLPGIRNMAQRGCVS